MPAKSSACRRPPGRRRRAGRRGTSAVEYALIAGLVACGLGVGLLEFGPPLNRTFAAIERALDGGPGPSPLGSGDGPGANSPGPPPAGGSGGGGGGGGSGTSAI